MRDRNKRTLNVVIENVTWVKDQHPGELIITDSWTVGERA